MCDRVVESREKEKGKKKQSDKDKKRKIHNIYNKYKFTIIIQYFESGHWRKSYLNWGHVHVKLVYKVLVVAAQTQFAVHTHFALGGFQSAAHQIKKSRFAHTWKMTKKKRYYFRL